MGFADVVKTALEATPQGQAYQNAKATDVANQQKKEQAERDFAEYVQSKGARPVVNGMVHRDWTAGNGSVIPNAIFDKAGNEGRQVISHKDPTTGQKIQWELGTPDEQIAHSAALKLSQQMLEKPIRDQTAQEAATNAGNTAGATTRATLAAQLAGQNTERQQRGVHLPQPVAEAYGLKPDEASGMIVLPEKLSELAQGGESVQNIKTQADLRTQQVEAAKVAAQERQKQIALQQLSGVQDQGGYDAIRKANPEATASWPTLYNPNTAGSLLRQAIPIEKQVEQGILNLGDTTPADWDSRVNSLNLDPKLASDTKVLIHNVLSSPGVQKDKQAEIQKIMKSAADESQKPRTALTTENLLAPSKLKNEIAARVGTAEAMNASGPELANVPYSERNAVQTQYQKSLTDLSTSAADASRIHSLISAAQNGNKAAPALVPIAELRGFLNRINATELKSVSSQAGSLSDQIEGWVKGKTEGQPVPPDILKATDELAGLQMQNAEQKHGGEVKAINMARKSNFAPAKVEDLGFSRPPAPAGNVPKLPAVLQQSDIGKVFVSPKTGKQMKITAVNPQNPSQFQSQPVQ